MTGYLEEALGVNVPAGFGEDDEAGPSHTDMVALEPTELSRTDPIEKKTTEDAWADYEFSREVAQTNLRQAQIVLESAIGFTNGSPSARSYEVIGNLIKIVNDCTTKLLNIQEIMRELVKADDSGTPDNGEGTETPAAVNNFFLGDPTTILNHLKDIKERSEAIEHDKT